MSNPFKDWTPERVSDYNARKRIAVPPIWTKTTTEVAAKITGLAGNEAQGETVSINAVRIPGRAICIASPSTDEAKLNKLERAYLAHLLDSGMSCLHIQGITLKLAHDCRLTVDFTYADRNGRLIFVDVKGGFWREDAKIKIKVAARMFPEFTFKIATRQKGGSWCHETINP